MMRDSVVHRRDVEDPFSSDPQDSSTTKPEPVDEGAVDEAARRTRDGTKQMVVIRTDAPTIMRVPTMSSALCPTSFEEILRACTTIHTQWSDGIDGNLLKDHRMMREWMLQIEVGLWCRLEVDRGVFADPDAAAGALYKMSRQHYGDLAKLIFGDSINASLLRKSPGGGPSTTAYVPSGPERTSRPTFSSTGHLRSDQLQKFTVRSQKELDGTIARRPSAESVDTGGGLGGGSLHPDPIARDDDGVPGGGETENGKQGVATTHQDLRKGRADPPPERPSVDPFGRRRAPNGRLWSAVKGPKCLLVDKPRLRSLRQRSGRLFMVVMFSNLALVRGKATGKGDGEKLPDLPEIDGEDCDCDIAVVSFYIMLGWGTVGSILTLIGSALWNKISEKCGWRGLCPSEDTERDQNLSLPFQVNGVTMRVPCA